jgi:mitotic spindle assembly checkpoint protein MAD2
MLGTVLCEVAGFHIADLLAVSNDDQVKAYIKKIMSQLNRWMVNGKISKLVVVITSKETGEHVERWQFDVQIFNKSSKSRSAKSAADKENAAPRYARSYTRVVRY